MRRHNQTLRAALCVLLCGVLCFSSIVPAAALVTPLYGDANDDGVINMKDVLLLRKYLAGMTQELDKVNADANEDGSLDMKDVLIIRKYLAGMIEKLGA